MDSQGVRRGMEGRLRRLCRFRPPVRLCDAGVEKRTIMNRTVKLNLGMTKAEVRELLGPPDAWSRTTRNYIEPAIWKYGDLELTFWIQKRRRIPYPGPVLLGIRDASRDHEDNDE